MSWKYDTHSLSVSIPSRAQKSEWYGFWTSFYPLAKNSRPWLEIGLGGLQKCSDEKIFYKVLAIAFSYSIFRSIHEDMWKWADFRCGGHASPHTCRGLCTRALSHLMHLVIKNTMFFTPITVIPAVRCCYKLLRWLLHLPLSQSVSASVARQSEEKV